MTGVWIPSRLYFDTDLTWPQKVALLEVSRWEYSDRVCFGTNAHFSKHLNLSSSRTSEVLASLELLGLIHIVHDQGEAGKGVRYISLTAAGSAIFTPNGGGELFVKTDGERADDTPSENRRGVRNSEGGFGKSKGGFGIPKRNNKINNNTHTNAPAREEEVGQGDDTDPVTELEAALIELAKDVLTSDAGRPRKLIALLGDDLPCTEAEIRQAVVDAADYIIRRGSGRMYSWTIAHDKAVDARNRRLSGAVTPARAASGGKLGGKPSSGVSSRRKGKHGGYVTGGGKGSHDYTWGGPPEIRERMVRVYGEDFTHAYLDPSHWRDGVIIARNGYAADKLKALPLLENYQIETGVTHA